MRVPSLIAGVLIAAALVSGCASGDAIGQAGGLTPSPTVAPASTPGAYTVTKAERALSCKRLRGRILIRAAAMRSDATRARPSVVATGLQTVVVPIFGGTRYTLDMAAEYRRDRARLEAYNKLLAEKKCKTIDIAAELSQSVR